MFINEEDNELIKRFVGESYVRQSNDSERHRRKLVRQLLDSKRIPIEGWDEITLEWFLKECAKMDSNNFVGNVGAGEREGRVVSGIVARRHFFMAHGIGRSGDVAAVQPKAAGSSLINKLATELLRDLVSRILQMNHIKGVLLLPLATGMTLSLVLGALRLYENKPNGTYVLWNRIDQATCLKAIIAAGYSPVIIENKIVDDAVLGDLEALEQKIVELGSDRIMSIVSTTSCFCPRLPDDVESIAKLAAKFNIAHVINNAYGLQCTKICHAVNQACMVGRVDAIVQSTDKNLLVPVGGAFVTGPCKEFVEHHLSKAYPGRASIAPIMDVFITLTELGSKRFDELRRRRIELSRDYFQLKLQVVAEKYGERLLNTTKKNTISFGMSLTTFHGDVTKIGSMFFTRGISGARVVVPNMEKTIGTFSFSSYGASTSAYPISYITLACAIGISREDIDIMVRKFDQTLAAYRKSASLQEKNHDQ